ncbi:Tetratricopeptide repeat-domain-containing protein [Diaporthe sp. PMI_573]|nr:Tetratricopeptide repeat-domain-containing protein [Diaporthaceae sp. PMI_573]
MQNGTDLWVFWIHAETRARIEEDFKKIAEAVKLPGRKDLKANIPQLMEQWLYDMGQRPWLLVLDNADNAGVLFNTGHNNTDTRNITANADRERALWTYLPQSPNGSILITSRNSDVARRLTGDPKRVIEVPPMDKGHALTLLASKVGSQPDMDHGTDLVEALEYIPLAISQAGAYIQQRAPRTSIRKYLEEFQRSERRKLSLLDQDKESLRRDRSALNSVITTWQISFDSIRSERPSAADLLSLMSFFDCQGIPEWLVRPPDKIVSQDGIADESEDHNNSHASSASDTSEGSAVQIFEDDLAILRNYCLISLNKTGDIFEMHNLVQLATRKWLSITERTEMFKEQFIHRIEHAFPTGDYSNWAICAALFAHVEKAIDYRPIGAKPLEEWAKVIYNGSRYAWEQGRYSIAEAMTKKSHDARMDTLGKEHPCTLTSMSHLATTYQSQGRWKEAEQLQEQVMEIQKRVLGKEHPNTLTNMNNLASTYQNKGQWKEAEELGVQVMEARKRVLGEEHPDTLTSMKNLALTYRNQGWWKDAEKLQVQVKEIQKRC